MDLLGRFGGTVIGAMIVVGLLCVPTATAARLTSPSYQLDSNIGGSFGGGVSSTNYTMTAIGGESIVGNGTSGSYKITQDSDNTAPFITVGIPASSVILGSVTSGVSQAQDFDVIAETNTANYSLSIQQDHNLQTSDVSATIPSVSGTTASPLLWTEGSTIGLGYSIVSAPLLLSKWSAGTKFAAIPSSSTTFYDGTGGSADTVTLRLRLDVTNQQKASDYANLVTVSGTITP